MDEHNTNNSSYHTMYSINQFGDIWNPILSIVICLIIVTINWVVIFGLWKTNKKFNLSTKLFVLWSTFNLLSAAATILLELLELAIPFSEVCSNYAIIITLISVTNGFNASTFILISILRNLLIRKPLMEIRTRSVVIALIVSFSIVLAKSAVNFLAYSQGNTSFGLLLAYWVLMPIWLLLQTSLLVSFNTFSQISLGAKLQRTMKLRVVSQMNTKINYHRKAVNTLLLISSVYGFCYVTTACYYVYCMHKLWNLRDNPHGFVKIKLTFAAFHIITLLGSALNGLIFILKNAKIKRYYRNLCQWQN